MQVASQPNARFIGGTMAEHVLFVVALCRFQHHSLKLSLIHYLTWSSMHVGLYAIALALFGPIGAIVFGVAVVAWAMRMDVRVGLLFGLLELGCALAANALLPADALAAGNAGKTVAIAFGGMVAALVVEVASHLVLQGYPPRPPVRAMATMPVGHKLAFVPYFVVTFGLFFLMLDLAMRLLGYRGQLHAQANAISAGWHQDAVSGAKAASKSREGDWHRRAIAEQS